jgi:protein-disulfide isomerase
MAEETMEKHNRKTAAIVIFFAVLLLAAVAAKFIKLPSFDPFKAKKYNISTEGNFWIGSAQAPLTIVEFSDFSCPYCQKSAATLKSLRDAYPGKIKLIYKDFIGHENSYALALAARCAGEQGMFWPIHDLFFSEQGNISADNLAEKISAAGADQARFKRCYSGQYYLKAIEKDNNEATALNIAGTPTFFINGYKISSDIPLESWKQIIDKFLNP